MSGVSLTWKIRDAREEGDDETKIKEKLMVRNIRLE